MKPYYQDEWVTIYHADARDVIPMLKNVKLVITDPPYGINHTPGGGNAVTGKRSFRRNIAKVTNDDIPFDPELLLKFDRVITWGANHYARRLPEGGRWLAWDKLAGAVESFDSFSDVEFAWDSKPGKSLIFRHLWKGVCQDSEKGERRLHTTQKPLALMKWCLSLAPESGVVLDPYMGSGTTLRAAKDIGRPSIGIELKERYCEIAANRMAQIAMKL